jgi:3-oxoacyl-[acyl-carrier protein] reductase
MASSLKFDFTGKRVIVTGASRGIGKVIATRFVQAGAAVAICARGADRLEQARSEMAQFGAIHAEHCDLADSLQVSRFAEKAANALGGVDILINNASGFGRGDDESGWATSVNVDLLGTVRLCRAVIPWLERGDTPAIVHITSITAFRSSQKAPAYAAVKAALVQYTMSQALTLIPKGIRVNGVAPGSTESPGHFFEKRRLAGDPGYAATLATQPTGRMGLPDDIAGVVLFLCSDAARWVVGQTIITDGGQRLAGG